MIWSDAPYSGSLFGRCEVHPRHPDPVSRGVYGTGIGSCIPCPGYGNVSKDPLGGDASHGAREASGQRVRPSLYPTRQRDVWRGPGPAVHFRTRIAVRWRIGGGLSADSQSPVEHARDAEFREIKVRSC